MPTRSVTFMGSGTVDLGAPLIQALIVDLFAPVASAGLFVKMRCHVLASSPHLGSQFASDAQANCAMGRRRHGLGAV